jgi:hypothetical protein
MHYPDLNTPNLILPPDKALVDQLKIKLAIHQRYLTQLKNNHKASNEKMLKAWYVVEILTCLLANGQVEPQQLFHDLARQQIRQGYGKKQHPRSFAAWVHVLNQYVSYRMPISLNTPRLK